MLNPPDTNATELTNAARLAAWALAAYGASGPLAECGQIAARIEPWKIYNASGLLGWFDGGLVVAIAGTNEADDWRSNLDAGPYQVGRYAFDHEVDVDERAKEHLVHTGFLQMASNVMLRLRSMYPYLYTMGPVWICGHSLGGAVASLLPLLWPGLRAHVVTYGAPRIYHWTDKRNGTASCLTHTRVVAIDDLVPQVPLFYRHPAGGRQILLRGHGEARHELTWRDRLRRVLRRIWCLRDPLAGSQASHAMALYSRWLRVWR